MRRALELAEHGRGLTAPNPIVGAVLVRGGRVVGEGWHRALGESHAEVEALARAGAAARRPVSTRCSRRASRAASWRSATPIHA